MYTFINIDALFFLVSVSSRSDKAFSIKADEKKNRREIMIKGVIRILFLVLKIQLVPKMAPSIIGYTKF